MKLKALVAACSMSFTLPADATLTENVNDIPNRKIIDFEIYDRFSIVGPEKIASGVSFTGTPGSVLGAFMADLGSNGLWGAGNFFAATDIIGTLHFTFINSATGAVGALLNSYNGNGMLISAFGEDHQIIESHLIDVDTAEDSLNAGTFFGITRPTADIRSISFTGTGLVADNITFASPIPEPETYAMMLAGLGLMGLFARRR
ncbi:MAG: PEP-CTERM sorting domain-containing protein [Nitrosospira sp.]|nr:PEP-CTERM sorting domain-containing protein [Nitrosospira sp.]